MHICLVFFFVVVDIIDDVGYSKEKNNKRTEMSFQARLEVPCT